jgi:hypothetical protein
MTGGFAEAWCRRLRARALASALGVLSACNQRYWVCEDVDQKTVDRLPEKLSETGLYADLAQDELADGVMPYAPRFTLWSDGATKRRWLKLPPGARIASEDMDAWIFPEGTQLWKEFTRDGVRVETRLLQKYGPDEDDWIGMAYVWADDQHDAYRKPYGVIDAQGTQHNVPAAGECMACHGGTRSRILGVSAVQLGDPAASSGLTLRGLAQAGLLTVVPAQLEIALPGTATEQAALGYLHANCSHCHNQARPEHAGARCFDPENELDFRLLLADLTTPAATQTYRTMHRVVKAGHPAQSRLIDLVSSRGFLKQMPPLASNRVDDQALSVLRRWIEEL